MAVMKLIVRNTAISREYDDDDPIWSLVTEKRERQMLADAQRDLAIKAEELSRTQITERG